MKNILSISCAAVFTLACASSTPQPMAMATLAPTTGQTAKGTVHFMDLKDGAVEIDIDLTGLTPGQHGFHVHEKGDCGDDAKAAGAHYNPTGEPHGGPS